MKTDDYSNNVFIVWWCNTGLEGIVPHTSLEKNELADVLQGRIPSYSLRKILHYMKLRALFNLQRHYEIYAVTATSEITEDDIRQMFENCPQEAADTMRKIGVKLYSDRVENNKIVIS